MMGKQNNNQSRLFYSFNLEQMVPAKHLLRHINTVMDLKDLRSHLQPFYSPIGRPSIDPELMIRILLVGYCFGIRSERRLCEEVNLNLAYRWFLSPEVAQEKIEAWRVDYNEYRSHQSLNDQTPREFVAEHLEAGNF